MAGVAGRPETSRMTMTSGRLQGALLSALLVTSITTLGAQTTVDGLIYTSFRYGLVKDEALTPDARPNNFEIDRAYLSARNRSGAIATRVTIDIDNRRAAVNQQTFRLKYAYVDWTPEGSSVTWRLGMQNTPVIGYIEDVWGYRMQGTVPLDRYRYQSSSDIGLGAEGAWRSQAVTAHVGVFNGEGYSAQPGDHRKDVAGRVSVRLLETDNTSRTGGLRLTGFVSLGAMNTGGARDRYLALVTYQTKALTLGAEYAHTVDSTTADRTTEGRILSAFATHRREGAKLGLMARVDQWDPNTAATSATFDPLVSRQTRFIGGVSYLLAPNVRLLLDADLVSAQGSSVPNNFQAANRSVFLHTEIKF
jgi:hypothetical protein